LHYYAIPRGEAPVAGLDLARAVCRQGADISAAVSNSR